MEHSVALPVIYIDFIFQVVIFNESFLHFSSIENEKKEKNKSNMKNSVWLRPP